MTEIIGSPITKSSNITKIKSFNVNWIINKWKEAYAYDVSYLFSGIENIDLLKCNDTGYYFFNPAIMGDSKLYEHLQKINWYYMPWKWEHEEAVNFINDNNSVLEIGCAEGDFLDKIRTKHKLKVTGIELNANAVIKAKEKGITVYRESIQAHSVNHKQEYDYVCSFQVLEHIADVSAFIDTSLLCLKPKGILIISVPNNKSYITEIDSILNMPPHHVGRWDENSLRSIAAIYGLEIDRIIFEPLQHYHLDYFKRIVYTKVLGEKTYNNKIFRRLLNMFLLKPFVSKYIDYVTKWIPGHTIIAVYRKK